MAGGELLALGRAERVAQLEQGGVLRLERLVDVLIQLLVGAGGPRRVEVAAARDVAVGRVEVEGAGDRVQIAVREELERSKRPRSALRGPEIAPASPATGARTFILSGLVASRLSLSSECVRW